MYPLGHLIKRKTPDVIDEPNCTLFYDTGLVYVISTIDFPSMEIYQLILDVPEEFQIK